MMTVIDHLHDFKLWLAPYQPITFLFLFVCLQIDLRTDIFLFHCPTQMWISHPVFAFRCLPFVVHTNGVSNERQSSTQRHINTSPTLKKN